MTKLNKVNINKQLQKKQKMLNNDMSMGQTQKSSWHITSNNQSKMNSYYNTKSSFGIRTSSKNNGKQSIDYSRMEIRGKGGQINKTSVKQMHSGQNNMLPKPMKLSSQYSKEVSQTIIELNGIQSHHQSKLSRNNNLSKTNQKTEYQASNNRINQNQQILSSYQEGPTSKSLEPAETFHIGRDSSQNFNINNKYNKKSNNQGITPQSDLMFDHQMSNQTEMRRQKYLRTGNNQIPLLKNQNQKNQHKSQNQLQTITKIKDKLEKNNSEFDMMQRNSLVSNPIQREDYNKISKTEAQNTMSKRNNINQFVDRSLESSFENGVVQVKDDSKSAEAVDYFKKQGNAFKQHMKSQQLKSRLRNLQYSQVNDSQNSVIDAHKNRGPKPNLEDVKNNQANNSSIEQTAIKQQLPSISKNQSKSETKISSKFDNSAKAPKFREIKKESALSVQKNRNHLTDDRTQLVSKIGSSDQISEQQTTLKTPQNNSKLYKKNFQYSQNVGKQLNQVDDNPLQTPQIDNSFQLLAHDSDDMTGGLQSISNNNYKIDSHSQEKSLMNDSYEDLNSQKLDQMFANKKKSANKNLRDLKKSPQINDNLSYSSQEQVLKQNGQGFKKSGNKIDLYKNQIDIDAFNNQSDGGSFPKMMNDQLTEEFRFAPMNGVRDGFGVGPGTANTHGGYTRQNYKRIDEKQNVNYKLPSQQCYSEIVNFEQKNQNRNDNIFEQNNQNFNIISTFEQSFEYAFDPTNFQNLDALDPKEDFDIPGANQFENQNNMDLKAADGSSSIPSIHSVPTIRNQKSQGTYRHNHQKINTSYKNFYYNNQKSSNVPTLKDQQTVHQLTAEKQSEALTQQHFDNMTNLNNSQFSGQHEFVGYNAQQNHQANSQMDPSQMQQDMSAFFNNDTKLNVSQLSNDSENGKFYAENMINNGIRTTQNQHQMNLSKRDGSAPHQSNINSALSGDEGNPFSGPKLHLFRKGQSKSSQSKQRKIKTSQYQQRLYDIKSNYSNVQNYSNSMIQNYGQEQNGVSSAPSAQSVIVNPQFGGSQSQQALSQSNYRQLSEGGGQVNSLKKKSHSNTRKTKEGHINISEILNGNFKLKPTNQKYLNADQLYTGTRSQNSHGLVSQNSNELVGQKGMQDKHEIDQLKNNETDNKEKSQKTPSQFSTIQQSQSNNMFDAPEEQHINHDSQKELNHIHFPKLAGAYSSKSGESKSQLSNINNVSPYIGQSNSSQRLGMARKLQNESLQLPPTVNNGGQSENYMHKLYEQQRQGLRPNTTNQTNHPQDIIINNVINMENQENIIKQPKIPVQKHLKPIKVQSQNQQNFKHPKVGNNSKHPQVFKNPHVIPQKGVNKGAYQSQGTSATKDGILSGEQQILNAESVDTHKNTNSNQDQYESRNQHFETTFENFNKDQTDIDKKEDEDKIERQMSEQKVVPAIQDPSDLIKLHKSNEKKNQAQSSSKREIRNNKQVKSDNAAKQAINQLAETQINQNELTNQKQSANQNTQNLLKNSLDSKGIQVLREKQYKDLKKQFDQSNTAVKVQNEPDVKFNINLSKDSEINMMEEYSYSKDQRDKLSSVKIGDKNVNRKNKDEDIQIQQAYSNSKLKPQKPLNKQRQEDQSINQASSSASPDIVVNQDDTSSQNQKELEQSNGTAPAGGLNMNATQTSHSIAQTPCFAETPNTTDQFKGYKIDPNDRINMSNINLNTQLLNIPPNLMMSSNGMNVGQTIGSQRDSENINPDQLQHHAKQQMNQRQLSAQITNIQQLDNSQIVESECMLESEIDITKNRENVNNSLNH